MQATTLCAALIVLAARAVVSSSTVPLLKVTVLQATNVVQEQFSSVTRIAQSMAAEAERMVQYDLYDRNVHLTDLLYTGGEQELCGLADPHRVSDFWIAPGAIETEPDALPASIGRGCWCRDEWDAFCNASRVELERSPAHECMPCSRACELLWGLQMTAVLDVSVTALAPQYPIITNWYWDRGNGTANRDWGRLWSTPPGATPGSVPYTSVPLNTSMSHAFPGLGNPVSYLTDRMRNFDRTPQWSPVYIDLITLLPAVTLAVPAYAATGELLGGFYVDMLMAVTSPMLRNMEIPFPLPMHMLVTMETGDIVSGSPGALEALFGASCNGTVCNVASLDGALFGQLLIGDHGIDTDVSFFDVVIGERKYIVSPRTLTSQWVVWFFVLRSDAYPSSSYIGAGIIAVAVVVPVVGASAFFIVLLAFIFGYMRVRVKELETQLGSVSSANVLGTPAEDVIKTLLRVRQSGRLPRADREDLVKVIAVIASNKLFKSDGVLREKLQELKLDKDVDGFLLDMLTRQESGKSSGSSFANKSEITVVSDTSTAATDNLAYMESVKTLVLPNGKSCTLDDWDYDVELAKVNGCSALEVVGFALLDATGVLDSRNLSKKTVSMFLRAVELGYSSPQYHTSVHAADVAQAMHAMMSNCVFDFTPLEKFAGIIAAICHDYGHQGVNNNFLQATLDPLFVQYNGVSVLESMHASESMRLLLGSHDFLSGRFTRDEVQDIHRTVTQLILATDMARHLEITSLFNARAVSGNLEGGKSDRLLVLQMMLKMADISNPTLAPGRLASAGLGLPVSSFMDRTTTDIPKCQQAFVQFVVRPMAEYISVVCPKLKGVLETNLQNNHAMWRK
eukprot:m51a1_g7601 putative 3 5 -cyclic nucleotide phosphodiesterase family protein (850) ;mRNA; f:236419-239504